MFGEAIRVITYHDMSLPMIFWCWIFCELMFDNRCWSNSCYPSHTAVRIPVTHIILRYPDRNDDTMTCSRTFESNTYQVICDYLKVVGSMLAVPRY